MNQQKTVSLNAGQQAACDGFFSFLFTDAKELNISGAGGVGKTYLLGHLIDETIPRYFNTCDLMGISPKYSDVVMTATTNKAAEVLSNATGRPVSTVHSFLSLRVTENYSTGRTTITKTPNWKVHTNTIIFVDECSMIDSEIRRAILEGTLDCKIVYVGDHSQLSPVMEEISPIYRDNLPFFELTEPMRNAGQPALMDLCQQMRETVATKEFKPISLVPGIIDWLPSDEIEREVRKYFIEQETESKILVYSNSQVNALNEFIRQERGLPEEYTQGELLINNSAIALSKLVNIYAEQEVKILSVDPTPITRALPDDLSMEVIRAGISFGSNMTEVYLPTNKEYFDSIVKYFAKKKDWVNYFSLKNNYPDLRPRYASTVHKSQGSTYDTVFIDLENLSTCRQPNVAARLLYVAVTRAKNRIVFYGQLSKKYGEIVQWQPQSQKSSSI